MIKGFMMASGLLTLYILHGKNCDNSRVGLYSFLNICWTLCILFAFLAQDDPVALAAMILIIIAYPAIIIVCGIRNRRNSNFTKIITNSGMSKEEYIKANVPAKYLEACERYRGRPMALETYLLPFVKSGAISKVIYQLLLDEYSKK